MWIELNGGVIKSIDFVGIIYNSNIGYLFIVDFEINEYNLISNNDKNIFSVFLNGLIFENFFFVVGNLGKVELIGIIFDLNLNVFFIIDDDNDKIYKYN